MIKSYRELLVSSLVIVFVFGMSANVLALPMPEPLFHYDGNIQKLSAAEINKLIDEHLLHSDISEDSWPPNPIEAPEDEIMKYTFDVSDTSWFLTKEATRWYFYYVGGIDTLYWESNDGKALSSYASIPDASVMLLLGSSFIFLGLLSRRKSKK